MSNCPVCGKQYLPDPETGYDGEAPCPCSEECEEKALMLEQMKKGSPDGPPADHIRTLRPGKLSDLL